MTTWFDTSMIRAIDTWATTHEVERGEAIRRLVEIGLNARSIGRGKWWVNWKPVHD